MLCFPRRCYRHLWHSPTKHTDIVWRRVFCQRHHLLQTKLFTTTVEPIRTVHTDVAIIAAGTIFHGAETRGTLLWQGAQQHNFVLAMVLIWKTVKLLLSVQLSAAKLSSQHATAYPHFHWLRSIEQHKTARLTASPIWTAQSIQFGEKHSAKIPPFLLCLHQQWDCSFSSVISCFSFLTTQLC